METRAGDNKVELENYGVEIGHRDKLITRVIASLTEIRFFIARKENTNQTEYWKTRRYFFLSKNE